MRNVISYGIISFGILFSISSFADTCSDEIIPDFTLIDMNEDSSVNPFFSDEEEGVLDKYIMDNIDQLFCSKLKQSISSPSKFCVEEYDYHTCMTVTLPAGVTPKNNVMHSSQSALDFSQVHNFLKMCLVDLTTSVSSRIHRSGDVDRVYNLKNGNYFTLALNVCRLNEDAMSQLSIKFSDSMIIECKDEFQCVSITKTR